MKARPTFLQTAGVLAREIVSGIQGYTLKQHVINSDEISRYMHYHWLNILSITRATNSNALKWLVHLPSCVDAARSVILPGLQCGLSRVMNLQRVTSLRVQGQHSTTLLRTYLDVLRLLRLYKIQCMIVV